MSEESPGTRRLEEAIVGLGAGELTADAIARHLRPLFRRALEAPGVYLATQSLGRPLDTVEDDLREGLAWWQEAPGEAWAPWLRERDSYRGQLAALLGAGSSGNVVPRGSAGQALRSVLNMLPPGGRVLSTEGEFDSVGVLLAQYAALGRIALELVLPEQGERGEPAYSSASMAERVRLEAAAGRPFALVVVSQVFFATGQLLRGVRELSEACREAGGRLLLDSYHALGVVEVDVAWLGCDYLIGGCYKYLRGGPGAAFLYLSPEVLGGEMQPLDTGWFALEGSSAPGEAPRLLRGGDAHLEGTPAVLTWYQARSGLAFTRGVGVERLRAWSQKQLESLKALLRERGIWSVGGDAEHGAFLTVQSPQAEAVVAALAGAGIIVNARGQRVRLCPDCLTTEGELLATAD
ncbi:MAG TPA: aminotransferase class V-fold PLP-dependent enzyme, partial [Acidobacteriaceae bacterium]